MPNNRACPLLGTISEDTSSDNSILGVTLGVMAKDFEGHSTHPRSMRWTQTWKCLACGHVRIKPVSYAKIGASEEPLWRLSLRARCSKCGVRGRCEISEAPSSGVSVRG